MSMNVHWWDAYIGKPWAVVPNPPETYTCGELVRAVHRDVHKIDSACIEANAAILRECVAAMQPTRFGLRPLEDGESPQEFDVVFLMRATREDHVGIAAQTIEGLRILHCQQNVGVTMDSPAELRALGYRHMRWYRHEELLCPK